MIFLIVFSRKRGLQSITEFSDGDLALANEARSKAIGENLSRLSDLEIALFEAADSDTLRATHRRYFESVDDIFQSLGKKPA